MARPRVYLDWNASSPLLPAARAALIEALEIVGNPSSIHQEGRAARALVEEARAQVAALVGARPDRVIFTSGGTEAMNLALTPGFLPADRRPADVLILSAGEHACALEGHRFAQERVRIAPLDGEGRLDLAALEALLAELGDLRPMLALQAANNETGVLQPVAEACGLVRERGGIVVCDAVQAAGRIACGFDALPADALALSGHKIGAPKGSGALVLRDPAANIESMQIRGGGQERGARAGPENAAGLAAFGAAAKAVREHGLDDIPRQRGLRDGLEATLKAALPDLVIFGQGAPRLSNTSAFALSGAAAATLLIALDLEGFALSSGSACSSGKVKPSHVLAAMGVAPGLAQGAIRVSIGRDTGAPELEAFADVFATAAARIARRGQDAA
ncbi:MAG: cysteine desulfurase family protein [Beijerinckiaceae bacterium]